MEETELTEFVSTGPKPFVFVLMPFADEFRDIYELGIKAACLQAGAYCERVDEQHFDETILQRICHQIATADVVVADMTGKNPNVFYEVGYAHALDKRVILLTQDADSIPFDLKHFPHIVYGNSIVDLKQSLVRKVVWCIDNPKSSLSLAPGVSISVRPVGPGGPGIDLPSDGPADFWLAIQHKDRTGLRFSTLELAITVENHGSLAFPSTEWAVSLVSNRSEFHIHLEHEDRSSIIIREGEEIRNIYPATQLFAGATESLGRITLIPQPSILQQFGSAAQLEINFLGHSGPVSRTVRLSPRLGWPGRRARLPLANFASTWHIFLVGLEYLVDRLDDYPLGLHREIREVVAGMNEYLAGEPQGHDEFQLRLDQILQRVPEA